MNKNNDTNYISRESYISLYKDYIYAHDCWMKKESAIEDLNIKLNALEGRNEINNHNLEKLHSMIIARDEKLKEYQSTIANLKKNIYDYEVREVLLKSKYDTILKNKNLRNHKNRRFIIWKNIPYLPKWVEIVFNISIYILNILLFVAADFAIYQILKQIYER